MGVESKSKMIEKDIQEHRTLAAEIEVLCLGEIVQERKY